MNNTILRDILQMGTRNHPYLSRFEKSIEAFDLRYLPNFQPPRWMIRKADKAHVFVSHFMDRMIFPIYDSNGSLVSVAGRRVTDDRPRPKYYNTDFAKSKYLFCHPHFWTETHKEIWVVEGYGSVIRAWEMGHHNVCATMGTVVSDHHIEMLTSFGVPIHFVYDGDKPGQDATARIPNVSFGSTELFVRPLQWGYDLDDFLLEFGRVPDPVPYGVWWAHYTWKQIETIDDEIEKSKQIREFVVESANRKLTKYLQVI